MRLCDLDIVDLELDLFLGGRGCGGRGDDGERGFEAHASGCFGVGENVADGLDREFDEVFGFLAEEHGLVVLGIGKGVLEGEVVAPPIGDGVAVDAGLSRGGCHRGAAGQGGDDVELLGRECVIVHRIHFLISG